MDNDDVRGMRAQDRGLQMDAKAWARFTGMRYTEALRCLQHPLAHGILGERVRARDLIRALTEHKLFQDSEVLPEEPQGRATILGENGLWSADEHPLRITSKESFLQLVLAIEVLRMFTPTAEPDTSAYSYRMKHVAEYFIGDAMDGFYVSNGKLIWAAAALGVPIAATSPGDYSPNANIGLDPSQVNYVRQMTGRYGQLPRAHHHRPAGYLHLKQALEQYAKVGTAPTRWDGVDEAAEPLSSPFHEWLAAKADPAGERGAAGTLDGLSFDYQWGVWEGDHRVVESGADLIALYNAIDASQEYHQAASSAVAEWMRTSELESSLSPAQIRGSRESHPGWGAGSGTSGRWEYPCPCGYGEIVEDHDDIPGFRDHDVRLLCDYCRTEWRLDSSRGMSSWTLVPLRERHAD